MRLWTLGALRWTAALSAQGLRVDGTEPVAVDDQGEVRRGAELAGAELDLGRLGVLRIERVTQDSAARFPEQTWLIEAQWRRDSGEASVCPPDAKGERRALMFQGYLDADMRYVDAPERFSISCLSGAQAKCLRWGYLPWRKSPAGAGTLAPYFESCLRMARADYCGNDQPTTRQGTAIDIYDHIGIQQPTPGLVDYSFEAGWSPAGAVCVHHPRIVDNLALAELARNCPRLAAATLGEDCDAASAGQQGALLFNRSVDHRGAWPTGP
ncbi:MAG: ADYC domain-containing protein [Lysobacterales bacterium]